MSSKILVIGAGGQIGSELTLRLRSIYGNQNVVASDIHFVHGVLVDSGPFEIVDAQDFDSVKSCVERHRIDSVYLMAAMLSAVGEKHPMKAWALNMNSLFNVLNLGKAGIIKKIFWPSSIAVFGPSTPKVNTPQHTIAEPSTVYGISKLTGERWCEYYHKKFGVDVRSVRYPGIISWKTLPGGGTTDYAIEIYHKALSQKSYDCFLSANTELPMMYIDDAIDATIALMEANAESITVRSSYNLAAISFTPEQVADSIKKHIPDFTISYHPDYRQAIADSWSKSIDDSEARNDWNWIHAFDLDNITTEMLGNLKKS